MHWLHVGENNNTSRALPVSWLNRFLKLVRLIGSELKLLFWRNWALAGDKKSRAPVTRSVVI